MESQLGIYSVRASIETDRPVIDFDDPANEAIDWMCIGDVLEGVRSLKDYSPVDIVINDPRAPQWDYYRSPGTLGVLSRRAIEVIGASAFRYFDLLPVGVNGVAYCFLRYQAVVPCLDLERSTFARFDCEPHRIMEVQKYAFYKNMVDDPLVFCLPEPFGVLYATESVRQCVLSHKLRGFAFTLVG
jgi:hypothetical protein